MAGLPCQTPPLACQMRHSLPALRASYCGAIRQFNYNYFRLSSVNSLTRFLIAGSTGKRSMLLAP